MAVHGDRRNPIIQPKMKKSVAKENPGIGGTGKSSERIQVLGLRHLNGQALHRQ